MRASLPRLPWYRLSVVVIAGPLFLTACAKKSAPPAALTGVDETAMDKTANPCVDFYQYACGNWAKNNPMPADQSDWGGFAQLDERNKATLHDILDKNQSPTAQRDPIQAKVGDYYAACMDDTRVNQLGSAPLQPYLDGINQMRSKADLAAEIASLHARGIDALFTFGSDQDFKDATSEIAEADQGGLGLPDRDFYTKTDKPSEDIRQKYVAHVHKMFTLLGDDDAKAAAEAATVMRIETTLAKASMTIEARRDPNAIYHKEAAGQFKTLAPNFNWDAYFSGVQAPTFPALNVVTPEFFTGMNGALASVSLDDWKTYLRWHLVNATANRLSQPFVDANFEMEQVITGAKQIPVRWKRCVTSTDTILGEALGKLFVDRVFGGDAKQQMLAMVTQLENAVAQDIQTLPWMTAATKQQALVKLKAITNKIGYPDKWRDYSSVSVKRDDYFGNVINGEIFEWHRQLNKIGKPIDRGEFGMTPPTVNAYYNPLWNEIVFPAGMLQPPYYDRGRDPAVNYGAGGAVIGHELTHGFDDQGAQFDPQGNLKNWWTPQDAKEFKQRTDCIAAEYEKFSPIPGVHLNGRQTLGENTADNGGLRVAYMAMMSALANQPDTMLDGLDRVQRFFVGYGQNWCESIRPEMARFLATVDVHSPGKFRANGAVSNFPEFAQAFHCGPADPMTAGAKACRVW